MYRLRYIINSSICREEDKGGRGRNLPLMLSEGPYFNINNNNHYYDVYVCVCISIESFCYTTIAFELQSFFLFYKMVIMMFNIAVLTLIAVGTNETFSIILYILQSNFL